MKAAYLFVPAAIFSSLQAAVVQFDAIITDFTTSPQSTETITYTATVADTAGPGPNYTYSIQALSAQVGSTVTTFTPAQLTTSSFAIFTDDFGGGTTSVDVQTRVPVPTINIASLQAEAPLTIFTWLTYIGVPGTPAPSVVGNADDLVLASPFYSGPGASSLGGAQFGIYSGTNLSNPVIDPFGSPPQTLNIGAISVVPEPSSLLMVLLASGLLSRRSRR